MYSKLERLDNDVLHLIAQAVGTLPNDRTYASCKGDTKFLHRPIEKLSRVNPRVRSSCMPSLFVTAKVNHARGKNGFS